jgi:hypothetical protein
MGIDLMLMNLNGKSHIFTESPRVQERKYSVIHYRSVKRDIFFMHMRSLHQLRKLLMKTFLMNLRKQRFVRLTKSRFNSVEERHKWRINPFGIDE